MNHRAYCLVSGVFFGLVALAHLIRVIGGMTVLVDEVLSPMWVSWIAIAIPAALATWAFRTAGQSD